MQYKDAIELIINRNSMKLLTAPAPSDEELSLAFTAAMSAPDHGKLRPWRFKVIRQENTKTFVDYAINLRQHSDKPLTDEKLAAVRQWIEDIPLFIAIACHIDYGSQIPEQERVLATGCATMNLINSLQMMGYGVFWSTGIATYIEEFQTGLGFDPLDYRFLGFLAVGTPKMSIPQKERGDYHNFVEEWSTPL